MKVKKQNKKLMLAEGHELPELAILFNEISSVDSFIEKLKNAYEENRKEFLKYIDTISKQSLE